MSAAPVPESVPPRIPAPAPPPDDPDEDTLCRAALTACLDGADALMVALLKGLPDAAAVWRLVVDARPCAEPHSAALARKALDEAFLTGLVAWGRRPLARHVESFHTALAGWHRRMERLPSLDPQACRRWLGLDRGRRIIGPSGPCWPSRLDDLMIRREWAPPLCLWVAGEPSALVSCPAPLAVVGSRGVNDYGSRVARTLASRAALHGHLVVSGGAMGTDAAAHWGALDALARADDPDAVGRTVAVFAGGLDHVGPQCNRELFSRILDSGGALVSELPPDVVPEARRFLLRNRIIAALASTVVVAQARLRSGALNTAGWAAELNREVYAVPGDITTPGNAGCNRLIADGKAMILTSADAADGICHPSHRPLPPPTPDRGAHAQPDGRTSAPASGRTGPNDGDAPDADPDGGYVGTQDAADTFRPVLAAIRRCRRDRVPASAEAIAQRVEGMDLPAVLVMLGEMEMAGALAVRDGVVVPASPHNRGYESEAYRRHV
ncbi:DNA-processing protein DprA [Bifidobacterium samirii]|uniref:DNA processing protein DprA n=1 Tax=Bifidobacterium samirii TaxID=2306974 RepID=A0A430FNQ5_9BIFI|nr:DNA-processing protein DprA [Bifidobacterium samirii]RSX54457.1 DNA processing protein DprA [Bifidobacterium samirii]